MVKRCAFTLIELLVVIAIIAILAAILFPVFAKARDRARQTACLNNSNQIGKALMMYTDDYDGVYPRNRFWLNDVPDSTRLPPYTWKRALSAYNKSMEIWRCPANAAYWGVGSARPVGARGDESNAFAPYKDDKSTWLYASYAYNGGYFNEGIRRGNIRLDRVRNPAGIIAIYESRTSNPDMGFWNHDWGLNAQGTNPDPRTGRNNQYTLGPWFHHNKRVNLTFCDGHSGSATVLEMYQKNLFGADTNDPRFVAGLNPNSHAAEYR